MGAVSSFLKPFKENIKYRLRWRYLWKDWFLGRHACLGYDVLNFFENLPKEVNFQKGRSDILMRYWSSPKLLPVSSTLKQVMARQDVLPLIKRLEYFNCLPINPPKFIFMDSFAELTDQVFVSKNKKWEFACGYSDLIHSEKFSQNYDSQGLLALEKIESAYRNLFEFFRCRWGSVPIIFLHFPIALESRVIYIERYQAIISSIENLRSIYPNLISVSIDEALVRAPHQSSEELQEFPYHYSNETYLLFKEKLRYFFAKHK